MFYPVGVIKLKNIIGLVVSVLVEGILIFLSETWVCFIIPLCSILSSVSLFLIVKNKKTSKKQFFLLIFLGIWQSIPILIAFLRDPFENWVFTMLLLLFSFVFLFWPMSKFFRNADPPKNDSNIRYRFILINWSVFLGGVYFLFVFSYISNVFSLQDIYSPEDGFFVWISPLLFRLMMLVSGLTIISFMLKYWVWFFTKKIIIDIQEDQIVLYSLFQSKKIIPLNSLEFCQINKSGFVIIWNINSNEKKAYLKDLYTLSPDQIIKKIRKDDYSELSPK